MLHSDYLIITNNPLVKEKLGHVRNVVYLKVSYEDLLKEVRNRMHKGYRLLTHPLSGSVKPNETPYKSVIISKDISEIDTANLMIIENAIQACGKFQHKKDRYSPEVYEDFQLIDWTLLESGMASADMF